MNVLVLKNANFSANKIETIELDIIHTESIAVSPATLNIDEIGATAQLTATVYPSDAEDGIAYRSSDENVAIVSSAGLVQIVGVGTCDIIASSYNKTAICTVTVAVELNSGKYRYTYANAANASNMLTTVATGSSAGASDVYMLHCNGEAVFDNLMININMMALKDGAYDIQLPSEMNATNKRVYDQVGGYPVPVLLPNNTTKLRCIAPSSDYAVYPLFFKHDVRASEQGSGTNNKGYCSPARTLINPMASYDFTFQQLTEVDVPNGYDSVAIVWKAADGATNFRDMSDTMLDEFKIICV